MKDSTCQQHRSKPTPLASAEREYLISPILVFYEPSNYQNMYFEKTFSYVHGELLQSIPHLVVGHYQQPV